MWWKLIALDRQSLSDLAGSASFFVWLFAQSPQLYENYRNSSCEGLSIVFLLQWMAGDATNLIGCLLTQQLPFQIAVAIYFCSIDTCILAQYYYYWRRDSRLAQQDGNGPARPRRRHARYSSVTAPNMRSSSTQASFDHNGGGSPRASIYRGTSKPGRPSMMRSYESSSSFRAFTQSSKSVADLANEYARRSAKRDAVRQERWNRKTREAQVRKGKGSKQGVLSSGDEDEEGQMSGHLKDSIMSDSSQGSDGFGYGFGSASTMLEPVQKERVIVPPSPTSDIRGRDMTRTAGKIVAISASRSPGFDASSTPEASQRQIDGLPESSVTAVPYVRPISNAPPKRRVGSSSTSRRSTRGAGIILLGITALFGLKNRPSPPTTTSLAPGLSRGRTLAVPAWDIVGGLETQMQPTWSKVNLYYTSSTTHQHNPPPPTWERIVGRISAWICTVLYMTSRLPQIWTNLSRKSVQGLSILLFMAAALGNALYSISILVNPLASGPHRFAYISESLPFLLGSGGTLIFDAIIVMQWIAWRGLAPVLETSHSGTTTSTIYYRSSSLTGRNHTSSRQRFNSLERQPLLD